MIRRSICVAMALLLISVAPRSACQSSSDAPNPSDAHLREAHRLLSENSMGRDAEARQEIEQYRKYKDLKEILRETFRELHLDPKKLAEEDDASSRP